MKYVITICYVVFSSLALFAQDNEGKLIKDARTGCLIWYKHTFPEDSVTWSGNCKDGFASGKGILRGFTKGQVTSGYIGEMQNGKPHGKGVFTFGSNRTLRGNFSFGEPLFLSKSCLTHLHKNIISEVDSNDIYDGDNNLKQLYYHALVPEGKINGALILMPGTWETTEHLISSTQTLCETAYKNQLAVLVLSINQRLTLTDNIVSLMNTMIGDAINRYGIPKHKIVIGGWSMGGLFSLRYTELSNQDSARTIVKPQGVFSCDGPSDLENIYKMFQMKLKKYPENSEATYGIGELVKYCGGTPENAPEKYRYFSSFSYASADGGNAKYLLKTPVRIYNDLDANWWMQNRGLDMYFMNGLDQTAMVQILNDMGNKKAEFINAFQKGYRIEGYRHPHSWSIVEPYDCIRWILEILKLNNIQTSE